MIFRFLAFIGAMLAVRPCLAQTDSAAFQITPFVNVNAGGIFGEQTTGTILTLVSGVRMNRFFTGVGAGYEIDDYWKSAPLVAVLGYDIVRGRNSVFYTQMNGGFAKAWARRGVETENFYRHDGGYQLHPMAGLRMGGARWHMYFQFGYRIQHFHYSQEVRNWIWGYPSGTVTIHQRSDRVSFTVGFGWG